MESPIPILPLPTPDAETEKLIRMKDEEVGEVVGEEQGLEGEQARLLSSHFLPHPPLLVPPTPAEAHAGDAAEDEAANAGPVTPPQPHTAMDRLPVFRLDLLNPCTSTSLDSTLDSSGSPTGQSRPGHNPNPRVV